MFFLFVFLPLGKLILILLPVDGLIGPLYVTQDVVDVVAPLDARVGHAIVDLRGLAQIAILCLLRNLHCTVEVLSARVKVSLLSQDLSKLHEGARLTLSVLEFTAELQVTLYEHL